MTNIRFVTDIQRDRGSRANRVAALVQDPHLRMCFDYWLSKCKRGRLPSRRDIDAIEMKAFLPFVILLQVERSGGVRRFRVRLMGAHLVEILGQDATGLYLDQICTPKAHNLLAGIADSKQPRYGTSRGAIPDRDFIEFEHLTLPLASDGAGVDMLLGVHCRLSRAISRPVEHPGALEGKTEKVRETNAELILTQHRAEEMSQAKSAFLANMSHELRTPLNAILGFSEIIRDQRLGKDLDRYTGFADDIHQSGAQLLNIVNDLLDVSKIEADWNFLKPVTGTEAQAKDDARSWLAMSTASTGLPALSCDYDWSSRKQDSSSEAGA